MKKDLNLDNFQDYTYLLEKYKSMFIKISDVLKGTKTGSKYENYKFGFFQKYFFHFVTLSNLVNGSKIQESQTIYDFSSVNVIIRTCLENYLYFWYIYIDPQDDYELKEFRFNGWFRNGLITRSKFNVMSGQMKTHLESEEKSINELFEELKKSKYYIQLNENQQKNVKKNGTWYFDSWTDMKRRAGFSEFYSNHIYQFLSCYVHTNSISLMQLTQTDAMTSQNFIITSYAILFVITAFFLNDFICIFPDVKSHLESEEIKILDFYYAIGSKILI